MSSAVKRMQRWLSGKISMRISEYAELAQLASPLVGLGRACYYR